ncbi:MAG: 50S ribosomal protein L15 [Chloroflexi bacterium]|nr:50S ribosomal protein L15 [Chloroflexota bacterium]
MDQHTLRPPKGAKQARKRVGRGQASGQGTYAGRGRKGQKARGAVRAQFEGGQMSIVRRLGHKRGFRNPLRVEYQAVNLRDLARRFEAGSRVDADALAAAGLIDDAAAPFKVLAQGQLGHALTVVAPRLSQAAKDAISAAGGSFDEQAPAERRVRDRIHRRGTAQGA